MIELVGLPDTLPQARVRELVSNLRPFTVGVLVAVEAAALGRQTNAAPRPGERAAQLDHLANTGIAGLSLDLATRGRAGSVTALIARAERLGVCTLCHVGADRRNLRAALVAGVDHTTGEALFPRTVRPADRTGARVDAFPAHTAFPVIQAGRRLHHHFRGLLRLHSRYGPLARSTGQGGLRHKPATPPVTQRRRSSATRAIDKSPGGSFLHW